MTNPGRRVALQDVVNEVFVQTGHGEQVIVVMEPNLTPLAVHADHAPLFILREREIRRGQRDAEVGV